MIVTRKANAREVGPALKLALEVFMEFEAPQYGPEAPLRFEQDLVYNRAAIAGWETGRRALYVALEQEVIVGLVGETRGDGHISLLFVRGDYQRRGVGTALMGQMVCDLKLRGFDRLTLNASPYGLPFYLHYGFVPSDVRQCRDGMIFTPMAYTPKEIWDVLDARGNKTGRFHERGRVLAEGDYHLVVQVWTRNKKGEWLIDRRAKNCGTSIDGRWETTGGAAVVGDDSLSAALREVKEELGLELNPEKGTLFCRSTQRGDDGHTWLQDAWVFQHDCPIEAVRLQEGETCGAMWASTEKILEMMEAGTFLGRRFYPYFDEMIKAWRGE